MKTLKLVNARNVIPTASYANSKPPVALNAIPTPYIHLNMVKSASLIVQKVHIPISTQIHANLVQRCV
jgi:hypothetical protein